MRVGPSGAIPPRRTVPRTSWNGGARYAAAVLGFGPYAFLSIRGKSAAIASTYFVMSGHDPGAFSQADLTRTDALYLSVTIFSTVGFGDISATSQGARLTVTSQMILDLLVLGIGINAFVHAARVGRERKSGGHTG